jgi:hypothetical protein
MLYQLSYAHRRAIAVILGHNLSRVKQVDDPD